MKKVADILGGQESEKAVLIRDHWQIGHMDRIPIKVPRGYLCARERVTGFCFQHKAFDDAVAGTEDKR